MNEQNEIVKEEVADVIENSEIAGICDCATNSAVIKLAIGAVVAVTGTAVLVYKNKEKLQAWRANRKAAKVLKRSEKKLNNCFVAEDSDCEDQEF